MINAWISGAILITILLNYGSGTASAQQLFVYNKKIQKFVNRDCEKNNSCDLLQFTVITENYTVYTDGKPNYGTRMYAEYETDKAENLPKYALVQFLKGCQFKSERDKNGMIKKYTISAVKSFGEYHTFHFPDWTIDSMDKNPVYSVSRPFAAQIPRLYITDRPSPVFKDPKFAYNSSLWFRICLYKANDVPKETTRDNIEFANPVICFLWSNSLIYNYHSGKFESPKTINPFCLDQLGVKILN